MGTAPTEDDVVAIRDLIQRSTLKGVEYHEVGARWIGTREDSADDETDVQLELQHRIDEAAFGFRLVGTTASSYGESFATVAVTYDYEGDQPSLRTLLAFGNEVAVMTLFPYFREAISGITAKVFGNPLLVPVVPRGEIGFDLDAL